MADTWSREEPDELIIYAMVLCIFCIPYINPLLLQDLLLILVDRSHPVPYARLAALQRVYDKRIG